MKVEGRKSYVEMNPDMVRLAKRLHRYPGSRNVNTQPDWREGEWARSYGR